MNTPGDKKMWYKNFIDIYETWKTESKGNKQILADKASLPYDTVKRIVSGKTENPTLDTLDRLAEAMGKTLGDIVAGTGTTAGTKTLDELQNRINSLIIEKDNIIAERDLLLSRNALLEEKRITQEKEIDMLKLQVLHKDELLSLHNAYLKLHQANLEHQERQG